METKELIRAWMAWKSGSEDVPYLFKDLARDSGIGTSYLSNIMTGARNAGTKTIAAIAGAFGLTLADFFAGPDHLKRDEGAGDFANAATSVHARDAVRGVHAAAANPGRDSHENVALKITADPTEDFAALLTAAGFSRENIFGPPSSAPRRRTASVRGPDARDAAPDGPRDFGSIPLREGAPHGDWRAWEPPADAAMLPRWHGVEGQGVFAVRMADDSMEPVLNGGDVLIVDPKVRFDEASGLIGVALVRRRFMVRTVVRQSDGLLLVPANPYYQPDVVDPHDVTLFKIALWLPRMDTRF